MSAVCRMYNFAEEGQTVIRGVQKDWRVLDADDFECDIAGVKLLSHVPFDGPYMKGLPAVSVLTRGKWSRRLARWPLLSAVVMAARLLWRADSKTVVIANGSSSTGDIVCLLNSLLVARRRTVLYWDSHLETSNPFKRSFFRRSFIGCSLATVWSKRQVDNYSRAFGLPADRFIFLPYKANHSKWAPRKTHDLGFAFAGGKGKRDFESVIEAVRDTDISLVISTPSREVASIAANVPNVILVHATEPSFSRLMTSCRYVVIPMKPTGLKGGGEANFCNAMWHGKALIAMDNVSADDYVREGETGYVVEPGDVGLLRQRMLELWQDDVKRADMGRKGRDQVLRHYTHDMYMRRIVRLAYLLGAQRRSVSLQT